MTTSGPIQVELTAEHLVYEAHLFRFTCESCGERLQLDGILMQRLADKQAHGMIEHITATQVIPFLDEHLNCSNVNAFSA
jgi:hypothetical protein